MKPHYAIFACVAALAGCNEPLSPPTPPLIKDAKAAGDVGHWIGGCPEHALVGAGAPVSGSPEIDARLAKAFPPGSDAKALVSALAAQGFEFTGPCLGDPTIQQSWFRQTGGGVFGPYPAVASVNWKVDPAGRVVWAYGRIGFMGP